MAESTLADAAQTEPAALSRSAAVKFVVLLGLVSLFADMTYEGARSVTGPYLAVLGASGAAVGVVAGFGELVGYGLRLVSGYWADRTRRYWAITMLGYALNMLAVPALALVGRWFDRAGLVVLVPLTAASALFAPLVFLGGSGAALVGVALWGVGMGVHESVMRAAVAGMVPSDRRGAAYGIFNTGYGLAWFLGSAVMRVLYDWSLPALIAASVVLSVVAIPLFLVARQASRAAVAG